MLLAQYASTARYVPVVERTKGRTRTTVPTHSQWRVSTAITGTNQRRLPWRSCTTVKMLRALKDPPSLQFLHHGGSRNKASLGSGGPKSGSGDCSVMRHRSERSLLGWTFYLTQRSHCRASRLATAATGRTKGRFRWPQSASLCDHFHMLRAQSCSDFEKATRGEPGTELHSELRSPWWAVMCECCGSAVTLWIASQ